ncbi:MAG: metallophosphoesterase [Pseudomonadota bacterium]
MRLLLLSDLHIGEAARCRSLRTSYDDTDDRDFTYYIRKFQRQNNLDIDYIIFPGDLTNKATPGEYRAFDEFFSRVTNVFNVAKENCFFTTGNHDSDWSVQTNIPEGENPQDYFGKRYDNLKYSNAVSGMIDRSIDFDGHHDFYIWNSTALLTLAINSGYSEGRADPVKSGFVDNQLLDRLANDFEAELYQDKTKLLLVHHHPYMYSNPIHQWRDYSALQNAHRLLDFAEKFGFDFIVHGHRHIPDFDSRLSASGQQLTTLCCGSFSVILDHQLSGIASNLIHMIEVEERDTATKVLRGQIKSWAFVESRGWIESENRDGIEHIVPFGPNQHYAFIRQELRDILNAKTEAVVELQEVVEGRSELKYCRWPLLKRAVQDVCEELGRRMVGDQLASAVILEKREA